ncbi:MAG: D-TA family PLP-dependent enzyme [Bacteroidota bacterium]
MDKPLPWYKVKNEGQLDSPSLLVFPDRVHTNIQHLLEIAGGQERLWPHVKTHKMAEVARIHLELGISRFKCATLAEAEMLGRAGAREVLVAHQLVGPKLGLFFQLKKAFPLTTFYALADDEAILRSLSRLAVSEQSVVPVFLDINNGMDRSGIAPDKAAIALYHLIDVLDGLEPAGLHVYDGHFRHPDFAQRKKASDEAFEAVFKMVDRLEESRLAVPHIIAGGSPSFPVHAQRKRVALSPGTYVFWDAGYGEILPELPFLPAALIYTRIISRPAPGIVCLDMGHKAIAPENPLTHRIRFLDFPVEEFKGQSEEHLVLQVPAWSDTYVGQGVYGIPWHICPTVALHHQAYIIRGHQVEESWEVVARKRMLTI